MTMNAEQQRLEAQRAGAEDWRLWGPYLAERAWGTTSSSGPRGEIGHGELMRATAPAAC